MNSPPQTLAVEQLNDNSPAGMRGCYSFMDDLCDLSDDSGGMVIVVDNAGGLFAKSTSWGFELITVWVLQLPS